MVTSVIQAMQAEIEASMVVADDDPPLPSRAPPPAPGEIYNGLLKHDLRSVMICVSVASVFPAISVLFIIMGIRFQLGVQKLTTGFFAYCDNSVREKD